MVKNYCSAVCCLLLRLFHLCLNVAKYSNKRLCQTFDCVLWCHLEIPATRLHFMTLPDQLKIPSVRT